MKLTHICLLLFLSLSIYVSAQSQESTKVTFTELTPDSTKFNAYLDTIYENNFFNNPITIEYLAKCQEIIDKGAEIPNKYKVDFALAKSDFEQNENNYIKSFQILKEAKVLLNSPDISKKLHNQFTYFEGYTLMILGDFESAQKTYYKLLEEGKKEDDQLLITQALFSLGQLYLMKEDYKIALDYYLEIYQMKIDAGGFKDYDLQIYPEIIDSYLKMKKFEEAETYNNEALAMVDTTFLANLKPTFLLFKVEIELEKSNMTEAKKAYKTAYEIIDKNEDQRQMLFCKSQKASILEKEGNYNKAIEIYDDLYENEEIFHAKLEYCTKAHKASEKMGSYQKAYKYSTLAISIADSLKNEKKMQQTELLAIKFEAEQKQKANDLLKAEMLEKQTHNNYLYALITIFILSLFILIGAFFQKIRYNKRLKDEVAHRTKELSKANLLLSQSNKEMEEFNRILSHDLKEPLRSIVSFSTLAKKSLEPESTAGEYLGFISQSGKQLNQLIEDVSEFQRAGDFSNKPPEEVESGFIIDSITKSIESLIIKKNVKIQHQNLPKIITQKSFTFLVFKNLIENGIKYNQNSQPIIQIRHREDEMYHYFEVEDNGIGINQKFFERIFGMFQRLNNRSSYEGTGLGLSMARKMMKKMNGDIKIIRSEEGKGSVFEVSLPIDASNQKIYEMNMSEAN